VIVGSHDSDYEDYWLPWRNNFYSRIQTLRLGTISSFHLQGTKRPECGGGRFVRHVHVYFTDYKRRLPEESNGNRQEDARPPDFTHADLQNMCKIQFEKFWKATITFVIFVRPSAWNNSAPTGRILWNFIFVYFSTICRENSSFIQSWLEWRVLFMKTWRPTISHSMLLIMRNVSDKNYRENQNRFYVLLDGKWDLV